MRRTVLVVIVFSAGLLWLNSSSGKRRIPTSGARVAAENVSLRDLVPSSALLAMEITDLDRRWTEIRNTGALAGFQDSIFSCAGMEPDLIPRLAGDRTVLLLAPSDSQPYVVPIAILRPANIYEVESLLSGMYGLSCRHRGGVLWVGPAGAEELLARLAQDEGEKLSDILPVEEIEGRLPSRGLIRGWVNPRAWVELLRDSRIDAWPAPFRWAAAALRAEFSAVRYIAFRRDFENGQLIADGLVAYDSTRLPAEVARVLDPNASPPFMPLEYPSNALAVVAFRAEAQAWMPWIRFLAASDSHGPLRNLGFWLDEFQQRFRRDLERDLFSALGDHGWLLALNTKEARSVEIAAVIETRHGGAIEGIMADLMSWMGEQVWLGSLGTIAPKSWVETHRGHVAGGVTLRTPFSQIPGPGFQLADGYLIVANEPEAMQAGRAWVETLRQSATRGDKGGGGFPLHGSILVQGEELAKLIGASLTEPAAGLYGCLCSAMAGLSSDLETLRFDMRYERDAVRFHGRIRFAGRKQLASIHRPAVERVKPRRQKTESLLSVLLSTARIAATWGMPAALLHELNALRHWI